MGYGRMDDIMEELRELTVSTARRLDQLTVDELAGFAEQRGRLLDRLREWNPSAEERARYAELVGQMLKLDPLVAGKMEEFKKEAERELAKLRAAKMQRERYESAYSGYDDGVFFDKKK